MRDLTKITKDALDLTKNPDSQKEKEVVQQLQKVIEDINKDLSPEEQKELALMQDQLKKKTEELLAPSIPIAPIATEPLEPIAQNIIQQLSVLHSGLEIFLKDPNDKTFQEFKDIYAAYLRTAHSYKNDISVEQLKKTLNLRITGSNYSGESLLKKVQDTLRNAREIIKEALPSQVQKIVANEGYGTVVLNSDEIFPFITNVKKKIVEYTANPNNETLIAMHFASMDLKKKISPAPLNTLSAQINLDPLKATADQFFALVGKDKSLFERLKQYPGWENMPPKD
jgi:hypothetical protein